MNKKIDISIIVPVFNTEKHIEDCLKSLINQTHKNIEIICVDDFSSDNSVDIIKKYILQDNRITLVTHKKNKSLLQARITGLQNARGTYILNVDSDDFIDLDACEKLYVFAEKENADIVPLTMIEYPSGDIFYKPKKVSLKNSSSILSEIFEGNVTWSIAGKLFKRTCLVQAFKKLNLSEDLYINLGEDLLTFVATALCSKKYVYTKNLSNYHYRYCDASLTKNSITSLENWKKSCNDMSNVRKTLSRLLKNIEYSWVDEYLLDNLFNKITYDYTNKLLELPYPINVEYCTHLWKVVDKAYVVNNHKELFEVFSNSVATTPQKTKRVKNIVIFTQSLSGGGAELVVCILSKLLLHAGYNISILLDFRKKEGEYPFPPEIKTYALPEGSIERYRFIQSFYNNYKIDTAIFNSNWVYQHYYDILFTQLHNLNTINIEHSNIFFPLYCNDLEIFKLRTVYKNLNAMVCLSATHAQMWNTAQIHNTYFIRNPLTFDHRTCPQAKFGSNMLLYVGRICQLKGAIDAIWVLYEVRKKISNVKLTLLGSFVNDDDKKNCLNLITKLNLDESIVLPGRQTDVSSYYQSAQIQLIPSQAEGAPMVLNEAKAHGLPSIAYEMPYLDLAAEKDGCIMVEKNNISEMANKTIELLKDKNLWTELSTCAFESLKTYNNTFVTKDWLNLFEDIEKNDTFSNITQNNSINHSLSLETTIMQEAFNALKYNIQQNKETNHDKLYKLLLKIFPLGSYRRRITIYACKKTYRIAHKVNNLILNLKRAIFYIFR